MGLGSVAALRQYCEEHKRFCVALSFSVAACAEGGDCCHEVPCEDGDGCLAAPFGGEWTLPAASVEAEGPRWIEITTAEAEGIAGGTCEAEVSMGKMAWLDPPPPPRGRLVLALLRVRQL